MLITFLNNRLYHEIWGWVLSNFLWSRCSKLDFSSAHFVNDCWRQRFQAAMLMKSHYPSSDVTCYLHEILILWRWEIYLLGILQITQRCGKWAAVQFLAEGEEPGIRCTGRNGWRIPWVIIVCLVCVLIQNGYSLKNVPINQLPTAEYISADKALKLKKDQDICACLLKWHILTDKNLTIFKEHKTEV